MDDDLRAFFGFQAERVVVLKIFTIVPAAGDTTILSVVSPPHRHPPLCWRMLRQEPDQCHDITGNRRYQLRDRYRVCTACGFATGAAVAGVASADAVLPDRGQRLSSSHRRWILLSANNHLNSLFVQFYYTRSTQTLHIVSLTRAESATVRRRRVNRRQLLSGCQCRQPQQYSWSQLIEAFFSVAVGFFSNDLVFLSSRPGVFRLNMRITKLNTRSR